MTKIRHIKRFSNTTTEQAALDNGTFANNYVAFIEDGRYIDWNGLRPTPPVPPTPYSAMPLTFEIVSGGTINFKGYSTWLTSKKIYCSKDNGSTWIELTPTDAGTTINVDAGDKLIFSGNNTSYGITNASCRFSDSTAYFKAYGNIMSLVSGSGFEVITTLTGSWNFRSLFNGSHIIEAKDLILPATALTEGCYYDLFSNCTNLTSAPKLLAKNIPSDAYYGMFYNCSRLNSIICLATSLAAASSTSAWVTGVANSGTFTKSATMNWTTGVNGIPTGWTVVDA